MGGYWVITVREKTPTGGLVKRAANAAGPTLTVNLLEADAPTLMTEWAISYIRIPANAAIKTTAAKPTGIVEGTMQLLLLMDGEIVWSQTETFVFTGLGEEEKLKASPLIIFAADLNNPIIVPRGRTLTLEATITSSIETDLLTFTVATPPTPEGKIGYAVRELTGHRVLS